GASGASRLWVRDAAPGVRVAPERLHGEGARGEHDVASVVGAGRVPRALVAVLGARAVVPRVEVGVRDGLRVLVAADDRDAVERARGARVHVVRAAGPGLRVGDVREVGVRDRVAEAVARGAVPRAVLDAEL